MSAPSDDRFLGLKTRAAILRAIRAWFDTEGFIEADVDARVRVPGGETHLSAFRAGDRYLHTSPEFSLKKLIATGAGPLYFLGHVWRDEPVAKRHLTEFTMAEWYRIDAGWRRVAEDTVTLIQTAGQASAVKHLRTDQALCDLDQAPIWLSVDDAFASAGLPGLLETLAPDGTPDRNKLASLAEAAAFPTQADDDWSDMFSKLLTGRMEPTLPKDKIVILHDYPAPEAALAQRSKANPRVAERFEVYACGVELANGFGELTDPVEQRTRFEAAMAEKQRRYGAAWPIDDALLDALTDMPETAGCALGVDRLVQLCVGAPRILDVVWSGAIG